MNLQDFDNINYELNIILGSTLTQFENNNKKKLV